MAEKKAQSAMEYLMTYGWAILIIAVVLGALFQLGVFNANNFAPKAPPGACQVFRPNGPGTTSFINLEGVCSGELPQYVAQFDGQNAYVSLPTSGFPTGTSNRTISLWVLQNNLTARHYAFSYCGPSQSTHTGINVGLNIFTQGDFGEDDIGNGIMPPTSASLVARVWYNVVMTFTTSSNSFTFYVDGRSLGSQTDSSFSTNTPIAGAFIGAGENPCSSSPAGEWVPGLIANVQLYNTSLSANEIQALYLEGIGGAPIDLQNLVAWWPLNGNANDYSGNDNNGQINNVNFVSNWYNGYTPP